MQEAPTTAPARGTRAAFARPRSLILGAVLLATLLAYLRCLGNGFIFDDRQMIIGNPYIGQWSFPWKSLFNDLWWFQGPRHSAYYRPLQDIWLGVNYQLFGLHAAPWHAAMVGLHLVAVWLVFKLAFHLTHEWPAAVLAALLFGLLPVHAAGGMGFGNPALAERHARTGSALPLYTATRSRAPLLGVLASALWGRAFHARECSRVRRAHHALLVPVRATAEWRDRVRARAAMATNRQRIGERSPLRSGSARLSGRPVDSAWFSHWIDATRCQSLDRRRDPDDRAASDCRGSGSAGLPHG